MYRAFAQEPHSREPQFLRVAKIAGLGERGLTESGRIDLDRLMRLRSSDDLAVFRTWLRSAESKTDKEIRDRVISLRSRVGSFLSGTVAGKALRIVLTNSSGAIPNPLVSIPVGLGLSALDSFLLERVLPRTRFSVFSLMSIRQSVKMGSDCQPSCCRNAASMAVFALCSDFFRAFTPK